MQSARIAYIVACTGTRPNILYKIFVDKASNSRLILPHLQT